MQKVQGNECDVAGSEPTLRLEQVLSADTTIAVNCQNEKLPFFAIIFCNFFQLEDASNNCYITYLYQKLFLLLINIITASSVILTPQTGHTGSYIFIFGRAEIKFIT